MTNAQLAGPPDADYKLGRAIRRNFFATPLDSLISIVGLLFLGYLLVSILQWAVLNSVWRAADADNCKTASGACWSVIEARWRLIFFGLFPADEHWRSTLACLSILVVAILSCIPKFWSIKNIITLWCTGFALFIALMYGGFLGMPVVTTAQWGGLSLTVFIFASVIMLGMPLSVLLAFGRRSKLPAIAYLCAFVIDTIRSFPLLTILFTAAVIFPFVLPEWAQGDKLTRVIIGFSLFFACYQAEILRGGLQGITAGQEEAAKALGMGYLDRVFFILLPQAFRNTLPATINQLVITFKETALVIIIGFFEFLAAANATFGTGKWTHTYTEVYVFVGLVYFIFVFSLSRYGAYLERRMRVGLD